MWKNASSWSLNRGHGKFKRVLETDELVPSRNIRNSFILLDGASDEKAKLCLAKISLGMR